MKRFFKIFSFVTALIILLYLIMLSFAPHQIQRFTSYIRSKLGTVTSSKITIATAGTKGHYYRLGILLKKEMKKQCNQAVSVLPSGGSLDNIEQVRTGKADFAFIQGAIEENDNIDFKGLRAVAVIGWQYVHVLVPTGSEIRELKDLKGKTVSLGPPKSGNAALGKLILDYFQPYADFHITYSDINMVQQDFQDAKMDAVFTVYDLHAPVLEKLLATGKFQLVSIPEARSISYTIPGCFDTLLPHSLYGSNRDIPSAAAGKFPTLKVNTLLITHQKTRSSVVQNILKTLYSTRFVKQSHLPELNESNGRKVFDLSLHHAADRFYRRNDPVSADKYEIGSALLAALLFLASVLSFIRNRYRARLLEQKKKNIIPYFEELLKYSQRMSSTESVEDLKELLDRMMTMQRRAEKLWLDGNLDTEHMENLYSIYGIRCANAYNKMTLLQMIDHQKNLEESVQTLKREIPANEQDEIKENEIKENEINENEIKENEEKEGTGKVIS